MTTTPAPKTIKPFEAYAAMLNPDVVIDATAVETSMTGNTNFLNSPVDLTVFKTDIESMSALIVEAKDGSKKVIAQLKKQRTVVIKKLRLLARYVEVTCQDDPAIFASSGFKPAPTGKTAPVPLPPPTIAKILHTAISGQLAVQITAHRKATSYEVRYAAPITGGTLGPWTTQVVTLLKPVPVIPDLTPGTIYAIQARALGKLGFSDWSDSSTCMCT